MEPRDKYWATFVEIKYKQCYYIACQNFAKHADGFLDGFCMLVTAASIASWWVWSTHPLIWSVLIAIAQVISVLKPKLPFSAQIVATKFLLPELPALIRDIDNDWSKTHTMSGEEILKLIKKYDTKFYDLEHRYVGDTYIPQKGYCAKEAEKRTKDYFYQRYNVQK